MNELFGHTRARIAGRHALITPQNFVNSSVPGIAKAACILVISEGLGAKFSQTLVTFERGGAVEMPDSDVQTFGFFAKGGANLTVGSEKARCEDGFYFFVPAGQPWTLSQPKPGTQLTLFRKKYVPLEGTPTPWPIIADSAQVKGTPFLGDPAANLQVLLPDEPGFDMAVNIFAYEPGGHLPYVEVHVMEHGLQMLDGEGVYRLEDSWYPVRGGDVIWMGPYCAQWFVAMGKQPARYLYYKDVNRAAL